MNWKEIKDTDGKYSVSDAGLIRNNETNKILKGSFTGKSKYRDRTPYNCHGLIINGKRVFNLTHRIVADHFIPNPNNLPIINHINENVNDNRVCNLEWTTNKKNIRHSNKVDIVQKDLMGNTIKVWESLHEIGDAGFNKATVSCILNNKRGLKKHKGFKWQYA